MLFNSIPFLIFGLGVFGAWQLGWRSPHMRWMILIAASLMFYGFNGSTRWMSLTYIVLASLAVFSLAIVIEASPRWRQAAFYAGLVATLLVLVVFKYGGVFSGMVNQLAATSLVERYKLPLALSFISFQLASYLIDVHRGQLAACRSPLQFFAFITFFPKLIAGPVVRGSALLDQLARPGRATAEQRWSGLRQFALGLFKKCVIADNLGPMMNVAFGVAPADSSAYWWTMALLYTAQSYADFSGYSDMALGLARMLGFELPANFAHPFNSIGFREFWSRWHISVSTWFRDYLFYPIAKSWLPRVRPGLRPLAMHGIIWIVMIISGAWHGIAAGYMIWGVMNAVYLSVESIYNWPAKLSRTAVGSVVAALITVLLWALSQIIFRATDLHVAFDIVRIMLSFNSFDLQDIVHDGRKVMEGWWPVLLGLVALEHAWVAVRSRPGFINPDGRVRQVLELAQPVGVAILLAAAIVFRGPEAEFIYFKF
jgi:alginate O-acetyltransferase complex protein AlgI